MRKVHAVGMQLTLIFIHAMHYAALVLNCFARMLVDT